MRREVKKELVGLMDSMLQLMDVLEDSKQKNNFIKQIVSALHIVENHVKEEKNPYLLSLVYKLKNGLEKNIDVDKQEYFEKLLEIKKQIEEIETKTKIVFFPYKVQMWGVFIPFMKQLLLIQIVKYLLCQYHIIRRKKMEKDNFVMRENCLRIK